jgi:endo-1,4-beta-xylanase
VKPAAHWGSVILPVDTKYRRFVALGLEWAVTEADIQMELNGDAPTPDQLTAQAVGFADLTRLCLTEPNCQALIFWGFTDAYSWIPGFRKGWGASLPLDEEYRPKPAYHAIQDALRNSSSPVHP